MALIRDEKRLVWSEKLFLISTAGFLLGPVLPSAAVGVQSSFAYKTEITRWITLGGKFEETNYLR